MVFNRNERHTLALTAVGHMGAHCAMLVYPTAAVAIAASEGIGLDVVLGWSFAGSLVYGLGGLPVGFLTDHVRARWVVRAGVLGIGPALMVVALAEPGSQMVAALVGVGLLASLYHPAGLGLISRTVAARGRALGINGVFGNLGIAAAPLATDLLLRQFGWRGAYLVIGAVLLLAGLCVSVLRIEEVPPGGVSRDENHHAGVERAVLFAILLVAMMLGGFSYRASSVAQPAYYAERVQFLSYGVATSMVYMLGTFGQYMAGRMADRYDLRFLYIGFHLASLPFVAVMTVASGMPLMLAASIFVFFSIGMQPIENSLVARFTPDRWRSTGYGLKFAVVFGIGSLSVRLVEMCVARYSLAHVFGAITCVVALHVVVAVVLALKTRGRPIRNLPAATVAGDLS